MTDGHAPRSPSGGGTVSLGGSEAGGGGKVAPVQSLQVRDVELDLGARLLWVRGQPMALSARELALLQLLMEHAGRVVSRTALCQLFGGFGPGPSRSLKVHMCWLRAKIEDNPGHPTHIRTVRGYGYVFDTVPVPPVPDRPTGPVNSGRPAQEPAVPPVPLEPPPH